MRIDMQNMEIHIADKASYTVKAAKTAEELRTGLMNVRSLSDNAGMLFDLRQYPGASMWMKNTYIPLDMLFIGCDWKVVDIYENAKPLSLRRIGSSTAEMSRLRELQQATGLCPTVRYETMFY